MIALYAFKIPTLWWVRKDAYFILADNSTLILVTIEKGHNKAKLFTLALDSEIWGHAILRALH